MVLLIMLPDYQDRIHVLGSFPLLVKTLMPGANNRAAEGPNPPPLTIGVALPKD